MRRISYFVALMLFASTSIAQELDKGVKNWYNGTKYGMSTDVAYAKVLAGKKSNTVVVAVIDSGVDIEHEDLKGRIWINTDEIPNNNLDDDKNGYIDDVNGWNFLGNSEGENINDVQLEVTRLYAKWRKIYDGRVYSELTDEEKANYAKYKEVKEKVELERFGAKKELEDLQETTDLLTEADKKLKAHFGGNYTLDQLKKIKKDPDLGEYAEQMIRLSGFDLDYDGYMEMVKYYQDILHFNYNPDIDPRGDVIGDNTSDINDRGYGNNNVEGPDAGHGTHCAGIIGALRNNGIGNDGVADNILIMSLRAVPNGDEWDKDVALAIRYAVDNGAKVINMSFGKGYSSEQQLVIDAVRYAEEKGVLLVHAAGNEGLDTDGAENYPRPQYKSMNSKFTNWIEVGASTRFKKAKVKGGYIMQDGLAADFSNYGNEMVDVFAPGHDIFSTVPQSEYDVYAGTSMAGPMVAGVAALLKSYYPELTMFQIREIILASVQKTENLTTPLPGDPSKEVTFDQLCVTAGIVNVYNAVLLAEEKTKK